MRNKRKETKKEILMGNKREDNGNEKGENRGKQKLKEIINQRKWSQKNIKK